MQDFLPIYITNVSVGNPPQPVSLLLDLTENPVVLPSCQCEYSCEEGYHRYNSSLSSTYRPDGRFMGAKWGGVNYWGHVSRDTIHFADVNVPEQLFEEWTQATCYTFFCIRGGSESGFDGFLGLAPPWNRGRHSDVSNTLSLLLSNKLLSSPTFSLKLPRSPVDEGELRFGTSNPPLHASPPITLPVVNATGEDQSWAADLWNVAATHITFNTPIPLHQSLPTNHIALFDSATPWLILPSALARNLTEVVGASPGPYWFYNVPCSRRPELPTLTFGLGPGGGRNFTISGFDYTYEIDIPHIGLTCITTFQSSGEFYGDESEVTTLGSAFMKRFYSTFDMEKREIRCESFQMENGLLLLLLLSTKWFGALPPLFC
ncbi:hypothetical protein GP486_001926 [Trichoglossum hirsutum]|uniref:Peptidase A1 domain-containing protein n=1 Tax=Trichoglossum hirsutum TaxID=265104 RepID=A0A9P8LG69_9PEZI|nr:hypothetical protein GP486_001926 [Trichoglossum hirsutum]